VRKVHDGSFVRRERTHASVVVVLIAVEVVIVVVVIIVAVDDSSIEKKRLVKPFPLSAESLLHKNSSLEHKNFIIMPSARAKRSAAQAELPGTTPPATLATTTGGGGASVGNGGGGGGGAPLMDEQDKNSSRRSARSTAHHATTNNTTTNATTANAAAQNANNNNNINNTAKGTTTIQTTETTEKEEKQHPIIHYRIGEILTKHFARKLMMKDGGDGGEDAEEDDNNIFEVRIPAECAVSTNRQVRGHQLWGTDVYTSDSDLVAVLMHCGYYVPSLQVPPSLLEIRALVRRVDDVSDEFRSSSRNGIRSRAWGKSGFAKKKKMRRSGGEKAVAAAPASEAGVKKEEKKDVEDGENGSGGANGGEGAAAAHLQSNNGVLQTSNGQIINADDFGMVVESAVAVTVNQQIIELTPTASESLRYMVVPTFVPEDKERAQRTRAASNANVNVARKKRMIREVTVLYNLCNEPWLKYSMGAVADKGFKKSQWTSARLRRDTLYLETKDERYQLSWVKGKGKDENEGSYQFAKCKRALPLEEMRKKGIPLPKDELKDEIKNLSWNEIKFGVRGLKVKESEYPVTRLQFLAQTASSAF